MAIIDNGKLYGIACADIKKQSTSWLKGARKLLAKIRETGEEVKDLETIEKEVHDELDRRLSTGAPAEDQVTRIEPEKMREGR
ncbi:MAG: hypothetical protein ACE145_20745 [Terriglobia bacterium]